VLRSREGTYSFLLVCCEKPPLCRVPVVNQRLSRDLHDGPAWAILPREGRLPTTIAGVMVKWNLSLATRLLMGCSEGS
jgi:hypothetical protein